MTETELIGVERQGMIALITFNRTSGHSSINAEIIAALTCVLTELRDDPNIRVVILAGDREAFFISVGSFVDRVDIEEKSSQALGQRSGIAHAVRALTELIENLGKPVIAAVNGPAMEDGCEMALACTWRIASSEATFTPLNYLSSLPHRYDGARRLSRIIGRARTLEIILTGESLSAEKAKQLRLVSRIVNEQEHLLQVCGELARQISRNAPLAIKYVLDAINHSSDIPLANGLRLESALFGLCFATKDVFEGTSAFLEKRLPVFRGQ